MSKLGETRAHVVLDKPTRLTDSEKHKTVIVAMDNSENSDDAFNWYWDNIRKVNDRIILLHVPEVHHAAPTPVEMHDGTNLDNLHSEEDRQEADVINKLRDKLRKKHSAGKVCAIQGNPGEVIVSFAKEEKAELIVTGCRGQGTVRRAFLGSVSDYVLHHADIPVLVIKHGHSQHEN